MLRGYQCGQVSYTHGLLGPKRTTLCMVSMNYKEEFAR